MPGPHITKAIGDLGIATLVISNEEMIDIMELVKFLEDSGLSIKGVTQTIENKTKEQRLDLLVCY